MSDGVNQNWQVVAYNPETLRIKMVNTDKLGFERALKLDLLSREEPNPI
jgi:hypothetical protein